MNILIIKPSSLGDVVHALPVLKALRDQYPESRIDWVINRSLINLLDNHPMIDDLIIIDKDSWKDIYRLPGTLKEIRNLIRQLRSRYYDIVIDLQGLLRSGILTGIAKSHIKIGFANAREGSYLFYNKKIPIKDNLHAVDRYLEIARAAGAEIRKVEFPIIIDREAESKIKNMVKREPYVLIFPSARWLTKRWPMERFGLLISEIKLPVVISGSVADQTLGDSIIKLAKEINDSIDVINLCGKTGLKELIALINNARIVITNDSGPMHISTALNKPTVAIFGPTNPENTGPYGWKERKNISVISARVDCSPCRKKKRCDHLSCMMEISVDAVKKEVMRLLSS